MWRGNVATSVTVQRQVLAVLRWSPGLRYDFCCCPIPASRPMLDQLIDSADSLHNSTLTLNDAGLPATASPEVVRTWCDSYARRLAERYLSGELSWTLADCAANRLFFLLTKHCGEHLPDYAWGVYLAFDGGEIDGRADDWTRKHLLDVQEKFGLD